MSDTPAQAFESIYDRISDTELGLHAIRAIVGAGSPYAGSVEVSRRDMMVEWIAARVADQLAMISDYAEEQKRQALERRS